MPTSRSSRLTARTSRPRCRAREADPRNRPPDPRPHSSKPATPPSKTSRSSSNTSSPAAAAACAWWTPPALPVPPFAGSIDGRVRRIRGPVRPDAPARTLGRRREERGVEIEVTPAGKATRRLSLLSGGEKSLVALAFVFAVFLARPSPFYILDEVEAALDDANIDRFLQLVRRFADRAQFVIVTHQKRTMDAADVLYGVSMGEGGITKVISAACRATARLSGSTARTAPRKSRSPIRGGPPPSLRLGAHVAPGIRPRRAGAGRCGRARTGAAEPAGKRGGLLRRAARQPPKSRRGARRRARREPRRPARRGDVGATRGDAHLRRRRPADDGLRRRAPRARGRRGRGRGPGGGPGAPDRAARRGRRHRRAADRRLEAPRRADGRRHHAPARPDPQHRLASGKGAGPLGDARRRRHLPRRGRRAAPGGPRSGARFTAKPGTMPAPSPSMRSRPPRRAAST